MEKTMERIASANGEELQQLFLALRQRYGELYPEEEVVFVSLPKNDRKERRRLMQAVFDLMERTMPD